MKFKTTIDKNLKSLDKKLLGLNNRHFFLLDALIFSITPLLGIILRLDDLMILGQYRTGLIIATIIFSCVKLIIFTFGGFYKRYWKYASIDELTQIAVLTAGAVVANTMILSVLEYITELERFLVPRSLTLLDGILTFILIGGVRFSIRAAERKKQQNKNFYRRDRVLIVGAGDAGVSILQEMRRNPKLGFNPIAFVDDNSQKKGLNIQGLPVVGNRFQIPEIVAAQNIRQVVIAMPTTSGKVIREIVDVCQAIGVAVNTLPATNEILDNSNKVNTLREVKIEDLLRREPIQTDAQGVFKLLEGKKVLITGAGGSIGSELCRQIFRCRPSQIILLGHGENSIFNIRQELDQVLQILKQQEQPDKELTELIPFIADLRIKDRVENAFRTYKPDIVFHAAAHKHVPLMELNPPEAITNNVMGTKNLLDLAIKYNVGNFVMISTDKAVNPTNVMGASKRTAEMLVLKAAQISGRPYAVVRFGNVLGSRGSVVPTFKQQIAKGGPVTITHPEITRYFMTIPEAVQLVLQASVLSNKNSQGQIFMLNMGQPVKIVDLAKDLIHLSGYEVGKDIEIVFTGLRPGEKLYEELLVEGEEYESTSHEKVLVVKNASRIVPQNFDLSIDILCEAAQKNDTNLIVFLLDRLVVGYKTKYQQINIELAQDNLEKIISQTCDLNPITAISESDFGDFASQLSLPHSTSSNRLTSTELDEGLKHALENQEFSLYYQPVMNLQTGKIKEFEALLRWNHPEFGLIMPQKFMGAAEESGLLVPIERWIVEAVCMQLKSWQENSSFASDVGISINIPSQGILQNSLVKHLSYNLDKHEINPKLISLEISEYLLGESPQVAMNVLPQLKRLGIQLQIDNFGRVASLYGRVQPNLLYREFDRVKIDRHLMSRIEQEHQAWEVLQDIIIDIENYGLEITATGIENIPQLNKVKGILCEYGQGYYLKQPLNSNDVIKLMTGKSQAMFKKSN
ncbi:polysaccharide biosynthesis protein [Waterburya agarophytonicola K14]|uniref:Polysaccharide biosynthesis protein n=1 Tax=Waterburya agarophytonicola KI4 TaxID=2874699 RepID=A0A964FFY4_9CYAN|nr:polysaccharide biosynthesis protein [Waterburya agarophytonicola]MCC0177431.1 polysaccharide biosynthesis protein [Waterburya agarophytonicola KI4]